MTVAGKRTAVEVTAIKQEIAEPGDLTKPRLRFDRVALRSRFSRSSRPEFARDAELPAAGDIDWDLIALFKAERFVPLGYRAGGTQRPTPHCTHD